MTLEQLRHCFETLYRHPPEGMAVAPGRVNLIGEFTDYNRGLVLPCALGETTRVLYRRRPDHMVVVRSLDYPEEQDYFALDEPILPGTCQWGNYIRGMAWVWLRAGHPLPGIELLIDSKVPQGCGLSSSAALEVAVGGAFNHCTGLALAPEAIAMLGQQAENDFMACQCGIMDQLAAAHGRRGAALLIDCQTRATEFIALPEDLCLVVVNSNYPRKLVESEYNQRRLDCEEAARKLGVASLREADLALLERWRIALTPNQYRRARHVISENHRVLEAVTALRANDMDSLRQLMGESHRSLRDDFQVTVPATDGLVAICQSALGERGAARMTGGGFGGAVICLCREVDIERIRAAIEVSYQRQFGLRADIHVCQAGDGLKMVSLR